MNGCSSFKIIYFGQFLYGYFFVWNCLCLIWFVLVPRATFSLNYCTHPAKSPFSTYRIMTFKASNNRQSLFFPTHGNSTPFSKSNRKPSSLRSIIKTPSISHPIRSASFTKSPFSWVFLRLLVGSDGGIVSLPWEGGPSRGRFAREAGRSSKRCCSGEPTR